MSEADAVARIKGMLAPAQPQAPSQDKPPAPEPKATQATEPEETPPRTEPAPAEPEADAIELPETLDALAEALGLTPDAITGRLRVPVKVNGEISAVTLADAIKGYQLEADYRQKTAALADERRALEAKAQEANLHWQSRLSRLDDAIASIDKQIGTGPTPEQLLQLVDQDPAEYQRQKALYDFRREALQKATAERHAAHDQATAQHQKRIGEFRSQQWNALLVKAPDLADDAKRQSLERDIYDGLSKGYGFTTEEIQGYFGGPFDHRHVLMMRDALEYRKMRSKTPDLAKKLKAVPKVQKPGATPERGDEAREQITALRDRLRKTGTKAAGLALIRAKLRGPSP